MREVHVDEIVSATEKLFIEANISLAEDVIGSIREALQREESPVGREVLRELLRNVQIAKEERLPICQDTGIAVIFIEVGQDVHVYGGSLRDALNEGVRRAYKKGYLRKSCCDPFTRENTGDNTPAIIHMSIVPGDRVRIVTMPKGGGGENYSEVRMLTPSEGVAGIKMFVLEMVQKGGPNPCPPIIVGIGIGGNLEMSALLSKEALLLPVGKRNEDPFIANLELEILDEINRLGIGPLGYGGTTTALDVHIKAMPCHIASLPVAVNIQCYLNRMQEIIL
jgi:fumarate hydratase subunit alpha